MKRRTIVQTSLAAGLMAGMVALGLSEDDPPSLGKDMPWRPIAWPFPRDAWPAGQAWRRGALQVYVRPKIGFCGNCETGVVTDEEVDRVTDVDLLDERFVPAKEGLAVRIGALSGRARLYRYKLIGGGTRHAEGIAVSKKCDLVIAVIVGNLLDERERTAAYRLLESSMVQEWISQELGVDVMSCDASGPAATCCGDRRIDRAADYLARAVSRRQRRARRRHRARLRQHLERRRHRLRRHQRPERRRHRVHQRQRPERRRHRARPSPESAPKHSPAACRLRYSKLWLQPKTQPALVQATHLQSIES